MSGFLPEGLANWALGGGGQGDNNDDQQTASSNNNETQAPPISEQDMRAKRMARLAALEKKSDTGNNDMDVDKSDSAEPMQVDEEKQPAAASYWIRKHSLLALAIGESKVLLLTHRPNF